MLTKHGDRFIIYSYIKLCVWLNLVQCYVSIISQSKICMEKRRDGKWAVALKGTMSEMGIEIQESSAFRFERREMESYEKARETPAQPIFIPTLPFLASLTCNRYSHQWGGRWKYGQIIKGSVGTIVGTWGPMKRVNRPHKEDDTWRYYSLKGRRT